MRGTGGLSRRRLLARLGAGALLVVGGLLLEAAPAVAAAGRAAGAGKRPRRERGRGAPDGDADVEAEDQIELAAADGGKLAARCATFGWSFRPGACREGDAFVVTGLAPAPQPAQIAPLLRWPDGSLQLVRVTAPVAKRARSRCRVRLEPRDRAAPSPAASLRVEEGEDVVRVRDGELVTTIVADAAGPLAGAERGGRRLLGRLVVGESVGRGELVVEERGPHLVALRVRGEATVGDETLALRWRARCERDHGLIDLEVGIERPGRIGTGPAVVARLLLGFEPKTLETASLRRGAPGRCWPFRHARGREGPATLAVGGAEALALEHDAGALRLRRGSTAVEIALEDPEMLTPWSIAGEEEGVVAIELVPAEHRWVSGERVVRRFELRLPGRGGSRRAPAPASRPLVLPAPSGAPARGGASGRVEDAILTVLDEHMIEKKDAGAPFDWPGLMHAGDWRWSRTDAGNLEYDTALGLSSWCRRRDDVRWLTRCERGVRHLARRDVDRDGSGLVHAHGPAHRGPVELGHLWLGGLAERAWRSGDAELFEAISELRAAFGARVDATDLRATNQRSLLWGLHAGVVLAETFADASDHARVEAMLTAFARAPGDALPELERPTPVSRVFLTTPWVLVGIGGPVLRRALRVVPHEPARRRFAAIAECCAEHAWDDVGEALHAALVCGDGLAPRGGGSHATGEEMLLFAAGMTDAVELGGSSRLLEVATKVAAAAPPRLRLLEKTFPCMQLSQLLWSLAERS